MPVFPLWLHGDYMIHSDIKYPCQWKKKMEILLDIMRFYDPSVRSQMNEWMNEFILVMQKLPEHGEKVKCDMHEWWLKRYDWTYLTIKILIKRKLTMFSFILQPN